MPEGSGCLTGKLLQEGNGFLDKSSQVCNILGREYHIFIKFDIAKNICHSTCGIRGHLCPREDIRGRADVLFTGECINMWCSRTAILL